MCLYSLHQQGFPVVHWLLLHSRYLKRDTTPTPSEIEAKQTDANE